MPEPEEHQPSLWERKRLAAMHRIQDVALELFDAHGYRNVTVERVAAAAAVSPSSIYRYFGTKEMLVLWDEYDPQILSLLAAGEVTEPGVLLADIRLAADFLLDAILGADVTGQIQQRMRFMAGEPEVRAGLRRQGEEMEEQIRQGLALRLGREATDLNIQLVAGNAVWSFHVALMYWAEGGFAEPLREILSSAIDFAIESARTRLLPS